MVYAAGMQAVDDEHIGLISEISDNKKEGISKCGKDE